MKRMYSIPSVFLSWRWHFASRHCMHPLHTAYTGIHLVPTRVNFIPVLPLFPIKPPKPNQNPPCLVLKCFCLSWLCWVGVFSKYVDRSSVGASLRFLHIQYLFDFSVSLSCLVVRLQHDDLPFHVSVLVQKPVSTSVWKRVPMCVSITRWPEKMLLPSFSFLIFLCLEYFWLKSIFSSNG